MSKTKKKRRDVAAVIAGGLISRENLPIPLNDAGRGALIRGAVATADALLEHLERTAEKPKVEGATLPM